MSDVSLFLPELLSLLTALLLFTLSMLGAEYRAIWRAAVCGAVAMLGGACMTLGAGGEPFFPGIYKVDLFSQVIKTGLAFALIIVLLLSRRIITVARWNRRDLPFFLFCSTFGMMMLVSATELLTFYVALEFSAYPLYILAALHRRTRDSSEGAAKYVVQGAVASAITLYGLSLVFGVSHTTLFSEIALHTAELLKQPIFLAGLLLALSGLLFKLAAFPFHFWAPDIYTVAAHPIVAFIATSSKLAAIAVLCRILGFVNGQAGQLSGILVFMGIASMTLGNLAALAQRDLKRMLAYSAVAHAGYVMVGLCAFSKLGATAALFYAFAYVVMGLACFLVVCVVGEQGENPTTDSLAGLYQRSPLVALALLLGMLGLAGVPPTAGFVGKWFLFTAALSEGHFTLVFIAAANSTVALYYYLRVLKCAYLDPPRNAAPLAVHGAVNAAVVVLVVLITLLGVFPGALWSLLDAAAGKL